MEKIAGIAKEVEVLDHHETAMDDLLPLLDKGVIEGDFDMDRCGAVMVWNWFSSRTCGAFRTKSDT